MVADHRSRAAARRAVGCASRGQLREPCAAVVAPTAVAERLVHVQTLRQQAVRLLHVALRFGHRGELLERTRRAATVAKLLVKRQALLQRRLRARKVLLLEGQAAQLRERRGGAALVAHLATKQQAL